MGAFCLPENHAGLRFLSVLPGGRAWVERLPELVDRCTERWSLVVGEHYGEGWASLTLRASGPAGEPLVLKLSFPHHGAEHEADALLAWGGDGAVRLLDRDDAGGALLLERCEPGTPLSTLRSDAALAVAAELLPRLWIPAGAPFAALVDEAANWSDELADLWERHGRPFERKLLDSARGGLRELIDDPGAPVLVSQDFHAGNVLRAGREPWLAIDPKPLVGDREFGVVALVRGRELGTADADVLLRLERLVSDLELDAERVRRWTLAHTLLWAFDGGRVSAEHVATARMLG